MLDIKVKIQRVNEPPIFDKLGDYQGELRITHFCILEKGMTSGHTSCSFILEDNEGKKYMAQTSALLFEYMAGALRGAESRFEDNPIGE